MSDSETAFSAAHARYYETIHDAGESEPDVDYYRERARSRQPALELACGTGRVYLDVLRAGIDVDGFDLSTGALSILRARAAEADLEPTVWEGDMTDFSVDRGYELCYCPFNTVCHALATSEQLRLFECVFDALAPDGRFTFDVFVPDFDVIRGYGDWETTTRTFDGESHEVRTRSRIVDQPEQAIVSEVQVRDADGEPVVDDATRLGMLPPQQVELLAHASSFDQWRVAPGFDRAADAWATDGERAADASATDGERAADASAADEPAHTGGWVDGESLAAGQSAVASLPEDATTQVWELRKGGN